MYCSARQFRPAVAAGCQPSEHWRFNSRRKSTSLPRAEHGGTYVSDWVCVLRYMCGIWRAWREIICTTGWVGRVGKFIDDLLMFLLMVIPPSTMRRFLESEVVGMVNGGLGCAQGEGARVSTMMYHHDARKGDRAPAIMIIILIRSQS